ncbi:MAG: TlyA family rRNA (cytidine-2'-O)-methyltransferase, partial [Clostridia bacterium]|nr:TlyA family rRNA (cytidine-2'-O)-methyltransferase [Clostridia bacterium]
MRVDVYLAAAGYVPSRKKAQDLIKEEAVRIDGKTVRKASETVNESV